MPEDAALIVVTGAGSGIGRAVVARLSSAGHRVLAADLDLESAGATASAAGPLVTAVHVDVADEASVRELAAEADKAAPVTGLVNAAGVGSTTTTPDTTIETWERVMAVNATGTFLCCKHFIPRLRASAHGAIVNIASVAGLIGLRNRAAYCASKGAVVSLTRALALDHVHERIRVNAVCPGTIDTPWVRRLVDEAGESLDDLRARQPMRRLGTAEEVAGAVAWLLSSEAAFVTGTTLVLDGGWTAG
jgi:NAD(P)-dependent dehydrogenase (short-subunit alcohol dehydrogenase family)